MHQYGEIKEVDSAIWPQYSAWCLMPAYNMAISDNEMGALACYVLGSSLA